MSGLFIVLALMLAWLTVALVVGIGMGGLLKIQAPEYPTDDFAHGDHPHVPSEIRSSHATPFSSEAQQGHE